MRAELPAGVAAGAGRPLAAGASRSGLVLEVDLTIYEIESVLRACYKMTDRLYAHLARDPETPERAQVAVLSKSSGEDPEALVGELCNELIDQQIRTALAREAGPLREMIVAQAFAEGNLLDSQRDDGNYVEDPRGAGSRR
jgi:His-Xaa-Ser system protein HxsD